MTDSVEGDEADTSSALAVEDLLEQRSVVANKEGSNSHLSEEKKREAGALLGWIRAVDEATEEGILSRHVTSIDGLCDGVPFFDILSTVDPSYFRNPHNADTKDNWVLKIGTLKRLMKLILQYYHEVLQQSPQALEMPDLDILAREKSPSELCKLGRLVIGIAVRSNHASEHIAAIQTLPIEDQQQLMIAIEQVMEALTALDEDKEADEPIMAESTPVMRDGKEELRSEGELRLEKLYLDLLESHKTLQTSWDESNTEREEARKELTRFKEEVQHDRNTQADILLRQEVERYKEALRKSEDNLAEAENEVERLSKVNGELTRKTDDLQKKANEADRLKDQMEEYKHASDRLQKTENVIEKYKKKLEEGADVRRQLKIVEGQYAELIDRNATVEDEYKRVASFKPLMDSYKDQITSLETKTSILQRDLNAARYETEQISITLRATEEARVKEKEEMDLYQERVQELELSSGVTKRRKGPEGDVNGVEGLAANNDSTSDDDDGYVMEEENIEDALNGTTMTGLKILARRLARELQAAKTNKADAGQLLVVENLLEDAKKMKARYEKDFLIEYQKNLVLEKQMDGILGSKTQVGEGVEANYALRLRLNETVEELEKIKREVSGMIVDHEKTSRALIIAKSNLNLVDKDKIEIIDELRKSIEVEKADLEKGTGELERKLLEREERLRMATSQINMLLEEKSDLQRDTIGRQEKSLDTLRSDLAASDESREVLASKEAQLQSSQEKLQKARMFIRQQDKIIKDAIAKSSATPDDIFKKVKKTEQENAILRQEQKLMMSAWYEVNNRLNRELLMSGTFRKNGSNKAQTKANVSVLGNKSKSWLQQQRNELSGGIPLARR
ncbi:hypothetical protein CBS101457_006790 [Exobasidium rhododendri]|nr:hypothetical protein CBS101457_006790 [Exobasidium rhododendri]